ncbi:MAG: hypothetical protein ACRC5R_04855 [Mycoplasmatales bacterium]
MKKDKIIFIPSIINSEMGDLTLVKSLVNYVAINEIEYEVIHTNNYYKSLIEIEDKIEETIKQNMEYNIHIVAFGVSCNLKIDDVKTIILISPIFETTKLIKSFKKDCVYLEEFNMYDHLGELIHEQVLLDLLIEKEYSWFDNKANAILINGTMNLYCNPVNSAIFSSNHCIEYLGLEDMDTSISEFYNRQFVCEEVLKFIFQDAKTNIINSNYNKN